MNLREVLTNYADLLDRFELNHGLRDEAAALAQQADQLRSDLTDRRAATLLAEVAASCQALAQGKEQEILGRQGLKIRMADLGLIAPR